MKKRRNRVIVVLAAALTFGSLSIAKAHHWYHKKQQIQQTGITHPYHCWFDNENNEGFSENLTAEQQNTAE